MQFPASHSSSRASGLRFVLGGCLLLFLAWLAAAGRSPLQAQPSSGEAGPAPAAAAEPPQSFLEIVHAGGLVGYTIMLLSIVAVALVAEHVWTIREPLLVPHGLANDVHASLQAGNLRQAAAQCQAQPSLLAAVLGAGLAEAEFGWSAVEKAAEDALAEQSARLLRKLEYLNVIGNIAPMLGLLGTVIGMVLAFRQVALSQGTAQAADLAAGIYLALVTTVQGLVVAIPALAAFAILRNRVDHLVAEAAGLATHALAALKRSAAKGPPAPPSAAAAKRVAPPPSPEGRSG